jgi:pimeloyl-ACP methyl ester carboxylesterase
MRTLQPIEHGKLKVRGYQIGYKVFGDPQAPAVLLLPAWQIVHSRHWKMQIPYLSLFFRVITYDSPGNGDGERTVDPAASELDRVIDFGMGVLDHLQISQTCVVGFSRGAPLGLGMAASYPRRVQRLIVISYSPPSFNEDTSFWQKRDAYQGWEKRNAYYWREDYQGWLAFFFTEMFPEPHSTKQIEDGIKWAQGTTPDILISSVNNPALRSKLSQDEIIRRVRCPVLIIHGTDDRVDSIAHSQRLAEARPDWEFVTLESCGHAPHLRDPVKVNLLIREFLIRYC